jgi:hypothetical protein
MEYEPKSKSPGHDVAVNYLLEYTGDVEFGQGIEVFVHCSYFNTTDKSNNLLNTPPKGSFLVAINVNGDNAPLIDNLENNGDGGCFDIYRSMLMVALQNYVHSLDVASNFVKLDPYGDLRATSRRIVPFNINKGQRRGRMQRNFVLKIVDFLISDTCPDNSLIIFYAKQKICTVTALQVRFVTQSGKIPTKLVSIVIKLGFLEFKDFCFRIGL